MPKTLPAFWETERLHMRDTSMEEVQELRRVFNACAYVEGWDPTFKVYDEDTFVELVEKSLASDQENEKTFKLQSIHRKEDERIAGYYHMTYGAGKSDRVWISMFVVAPEYQKEHYGSEVAARMLTSLSEIGIYKTAELQVFLRNWPALRFWIQCGFNQILEYEGDKVDTPNSYASLVLAKRL